MAFDTKLRCRERCGQRARLERAMHRAGGAAFTLHLLNNRDIIPVKPGGVGTPVSDRV